MRHLVTSTLCLGLLASAAYSQALSPLRLTVVAQNSEPESFNPTPAEPERAESNTSAPTPTNLVDVTCQTLGSAALVNDLPLRIFRANISPQAECPSNLDRPGAAHIFCCRAPKYLFPLQ
jgi:hypothetical protein